jgi:hypothetical protein
MTTKTAEELCRERDERDAALKTLRPSERALMERLVRGFLFIARAMQKDVLRYKRMHDAAGSGSPWHGHYLSARSNRYWQFAASRDVKNDFAWFAQGEQKARRERQHQRKLGRIRAGYGLTTRRAA